MPMIDYTAENLILLGKAFTNLMNITRTGARNERHYRLRQAKSGDVTLAYYGNDASSGEVLFHSPYNPVHEARRWADQQQATIGDARHVLVYGLGLGYHLEQLTQRYPDKRIYVFEPDPEVWLAMVQARDLAPILSHPALAAVGIGGTIQDRSEFVSLVNEQITDSFSMLVTPVYNQLYQDDLVVFLDDFKKAALEYRSSYVTTLHYQKKWTTNVLHNVSSVLKSRSIKGLRHAFPDIPAVIIGSGPSLMDDLDQLHGLKQHALFIAAGTSVQALAAHGIAPHIAISMDGGQPNYRAYRGVDLTGVALVYSPFIHRRILQETNANLFHYYYQQDLITKYLLDAVAEPELQSTFSVTGAAIQFASYLGCNRIILVGQDLSFPGHVHYARGIDHLGKEHLAKQMNMADEWVDNVAGGQNPTNRKMLLTLRDIEQVIRKTDIAFINTSQGGAKIAGTEFLPLAQVAADLRDTQVDAELVSHRLEQCTEPHDLTVQRNAYRKLQHLRAEIEPFSDRLRSMSNQMARMDQANHDLELTLRQFDSEWSQLVNGNLFQVVVRFLFQAQLSRVQRYLSDLAQERDVTVKAALVRQHLGPLVATLKEETPWLCKLLDDAIEKMELAYGRS